MKRFLIVSSFVFKLMPLVLAPLVLAASSGAGKPIGIDFHVVERITDKETGVTLDIIERRDGFPHNFDGSGSSEETPILEMLRDDPDAFEPFGLKILNDKQFTMPSTSNDANTLLEIYERKFAYPINFRFGDASIGPNGVTDDFEMARLIANKQVPLATSSDRHFHDFFAHLKDYLVIPPKAFDVASQNMSVLLAIQQDAVLKDVTMVQMFIDRYIKTTINELDNVVFTLPDSATGLPDEYIVSDIADQVYAFMGYEDFENDTIDLKERLQTYVGSDVNLQNRLNSVIEGAGGFKSASYNEIKNIVTHRALHQQNFFPNFKGYDEFKDANGVHTRSAYYVSNEAGLKQVLSEGALMSIDPSSDPAKTHIRAFESFDDARVFLSRTEGFYGDRIYQINYVPENAVSPQSLGLDGPGIMISGKFSVVGERRFPNTAKPIDSFRPKSLITFGVIDAGLIGLEAATLYSQFKREYEAATSEAEKAAIMKQYLTSMGISAGVGAGVGGGLYWLQAHGAPALKVALSGKVHPGVLRAAAYSGAFALAGLVGWGSYETGKAFYAEYDAQILDLVQFLVGSGYEPNPEAALENLDSRLLNSVHANASTRPWQQRFTHPTDVYQTAMRMFRGGPVLSNESVDITSTTNIETYDLASDYLLLFYTASLIKEMLKKPDLSSNQLVAIDSVLEGYKDGVIHLKQKMNRLNGLAALSTIDFDSLDNFASQIQVVINNYGEEGPITKYTNTGNLFPVSVDPSTVSSLPNDPGYMGSNGRETNVNSNNVVYSLEGELQRGTSVGAINSLFTGTGVSSDISFSYPNYDNALQVFQQQNYTDQGGVVTFIDDPMYYNQNSSSVYRGGEAGVGQPGEVHIRIRMISPFD